jgi:hypothetical protein
MFAAPEVVTDHASWRVTIADILVRARTRTRETERKIRKLADGVLRGSNRRW